MNRNNIGNSTCANEHILNMNNFRKKYFFQKKKEELETLKCTGCSTKNNNVINIFNRNYYTAMLRWERSPNWFIDYGSFKNIDELLQHTHALIMNVSFCFVN